MSRARLFLFLFLTAPLFCRASDGRAVIDEMNLARTRPGEYAAILETRMEGVPGADPRCVAEAEAFLKRQRPLAALQCEPGLVKSAGEQVSSQGATGETGHRGSDGGSPWSRISKQGQWIGSAGENISYGYQDARSIVVALIVDQGVPSRSHRKNIFSPDFKLAGAACGPHPRYGCMCVIDFAGGFAKKGGKKAATEPWWAATE